MRGMHVERAAVRSCAVWVLLAIVLAAAPGSAQEAVTVTTETLTGSTLGDRLVFAGLGSSALPEDAKIGLVAVKTGAGWFGDHWELRLLWFQSGRSFWPRTRPAG